MNFHSILNYEAMKESVLLSEEHWNESKPNHVEQLKMRSEFTFHQNGDLRFRLENNQNLEFERKIFKREDKVNRSVDR